jgi:hypothetical protein
MDGFYTDDFDNRNDFGIGDDFEDDYEDFGDFYECYRAEESHASSYFSLIESLDGSRYRGGWY